MHGNVIDKTLREVMRHVILHEKFESIEIYLNGRKAQYDIVCHCGKEWVIKDWDMRNHNVERRYVYDLIYDMNNSSFMDQLATIKENGAYETAKKEELMSKTKSPTISSLEI